MPRTCIYLLKDRFLILILYVLRNTWTGHVEVLASKLTRNSVNYNSNNSNYGIPWHPDHD